MVLRAARTVCGGLSKTSVFNKLKTMPRTTRRLSILTSDEIRGLFGIPCLSPEEYDIYFSLDPAETRLFESLRSPNTKLLFLLQLGYFKVSHQFFVFSWQEISVERNYLVARYFPQETLPEVLPSKNTRLSQQKMILRCQRYRGFGQAEHHFLSDKARHLSRIHAQPRFLLTELFRILETERITVPSYSTFQKIISLATTDEQRRLNACIQHQVPQSIKNALNELLTVDGSFYHLTALKKRAKDFKLNQIRQEIQKHSSTGQLYEFSRALF